MAEEIKTTETPAAEPPKTEQAPKPEPPKEDPEITKLKAALSRANAEAAEFKRQLRDKQTAQEKEEADRKEYEAKREARIAELEAKERFNTYKDKLLSAGWDAATAEVMAKSLPADLGDEFFAAQKTYFETQRQAMQTAALKNQPGLSVGMPPTADPKKAEMNKIRGYAGLPPLP